MYKDPEFGTNISIENIRTENFISYVYLKFLTPRPSAENKLYRLYIEDLDTGIYDLALQSHIWIDRKDSTITEDVTPNTDVININRNKTIYVPIKLFMQSISNNRFIKRCRLHLKRQGIMSEKEHSVWISDDLILPSREVLVPDIHCKSIHILDDGRLECNVSMVYPTARDETNFNLYLIPYVLFYDKTNLVETEVVEQTEANGSFKFESKGIYSFDTMKDKPQTINNSIKKIAVELRFLNGSLATRKEFILDAFKNYAAFYADNYNINKCESIGVTYFDQASMCYKVKNVIDIYQQK